MQLVLGKIRAARAERVRYVGIPYLLSFPAHARMMTL